MSWAAYGKLKDQIRSIQDELNYRQGDGESFTHALRSFIESTQDEAARHRQASRDLFKVDDDFANSPAGAVFSTIGGLTTLPANISPIGIPVTVAQTYQGGYDDYVQACERQGLPVNRDDKRRPSVGSRLRRLEQKSWAFSCYGCRRARAANLWTA